MTIGCYFVSTITETRKEIEMKYQPGDTIWHLDARPIFANGNIGRTVKRHIVKEPGVVAVQNESGFYDIDVQTKISKNKSITRHLLRIREDEIETR
jgi:hypothetical protein